MDCKEMILSDSFVDVLLDYPLKLLPYDISAVPHCYLELDECFGILYIELPQSGIQTAATNQYAYVPKCYALTGNSALQSVQQQSHQLQNPQLQTPQLQSSQIQSAQLQSAQLAQQPLSGAYEKTGILNMQQPPFSLTGKGILIGIIDTGVRYRLSQFQKEDGTTKLAAIWDQTDQSGVPPEGLLYGTEYTRQQINEALLQPDGSPILSDESGHGTKVASAALNAAPDAELVVVKCRTAKPLLKEYYGIPTSATAFSESDIMTALHYLELVSQRENKPIVICITMGTNMGNHTSTSMLGRYLMVLGYRKQHCVVVAGGNEGNSAHHFFGNIRLNTEKTYEDMEIRVSEQTSGFFMEIWGSVPYSYSISVTAPDGESAQRIPIRYGMERNLFFVYSRTTVRVSYLLTERSSGQQLIFLRFSSPSAGIWTIRVFAEGGYGTAPFDAWLPVDAFLEKPVYFLKPDPDMTMTEPSYCMNAIGISYYNSANNSFAIESGRGGRYFGEYTPSMSVAGVDVQTVLGRETGSSISAALMGGAVAQFMQWGIVDQQDLLLSSAEIRNLFARGAERESDREYPNPLWGYGRMNIEGVFRKIIADI